MGPGFISLVRIYNSKENQYQLHSSTLMGYVFYVSNPCSYREPFMRNCVPQKYTILGYIATCSLLTVNRISEEHVDSIVSCVLPTSETLTDFQRTTRRYVP
jgi:hypothetical protein